MSTDANYDRRNGATRIAKSNPRWALWPALLLAAVVAANVCSAQTEEADEAYLKVYNLIEQADALAAKAQSTQALAKYKQCQSGLRDFQKAHPDWNVRVVNYRARYVAERIAALSAPPAAADESATPGATTGATNEAKSGAPAAGAVSASGVKLLSAGAEPRKALRLHPKAGDTQSLAMTIKMGIATRMGDVDTPPMKLPGMKMVMDFLVKRVAANGDIAYEMTLSDASLVESPDAMPQAVEAMKAEMAKIKGLTGTGVMTDRGVNTVADIKAAAGADAGARQAAEQVRESLGQFTTALPEEEVGVGAKWERQSTIKSQGMTLRQTASYELVSIEGDVVNAKSTVSQTAANQKIQSPAMPGMTVDLTKMTGKGTGTLALDLARPLPSKAEVDYHTDAVMGLDMGGQKQKLSMKMDIQTTVESQ